MKPVPFDFRKPVRLPAEWHKVLMSWFQTAAALTARAWARQFPTPGAMDQESKGLSLAALILEDGYAQELLAGLPADHFGQRIMIGDGSIPTMLAMPRQLMLNLVGSMLGESSPQDDHELTVVEEDLADYFLIHHWLPGFRDSWPGPTTPPFQLQHREVQPRYSRLFAPTDILVSLHWQVAGPWGRAGGQWLFPRGALIQSLSKEPAPAPATIGEKEIAARKAQLIRDFPLSIECILGTAQLKLSELSQLQVGDLVLLDGGTSDGVIARTGGRPLFRGQAGRSGAWKAIRIDSVIEK